MTVEALNSRVHLLIPGIAIDDDGKVYIVARYSPPGNIIGRYEENVMALSFAHPTEMLISLIFLILIF